MNEETLIKYLKYLIGEADRYQNDGIATDTEMMQFINELTLFKKKILESDLSVSIKSKIEKLNFEYSLERIKRSNFYFFAAFLSLGVWAYIIQNRNNRNRVFALNGIRNDLHKLLREII